MMITHLLQNNQITSLRMKYLTFLFLRNENVTKKDKTKERRQENSYGQLDFTEVFSNFIVHCTVQILSLLGLNYLLSSILYIRFATFYQSNNISI